MVALKHHRLLIQLSGFEARFIARGLDSNSIVPRDSVEAVLLVSAPSAASVMSTRKMLAVELNSTYREKVAWRTLNASVEGRSPSILTNRESVLVV